jgi:hypothetical protein
MGRGPALFQQIAPASFVQAALGSSAAFAAMYGEAPLLCVNLSDSLDAELEAGLQAATERADGEVHNIAFHTAMVGSQMGGPTRSHAFGVQELFRRLERARHFVVPIEKRSSEGISMDRITVGRARNKDIVLRHGSVSKSHAWFERSPEGEVFIADAGSTNGTLVEGRALAPRELTPVSYGAPLRFGSIDAFVCDATVLWEALHD